MKILKTILLFITILLGVAQLSFSQSTETAILTFTFPQQTTPAVIDDISHTIEIEVFYDTDATNLIPTFTLSSGADASIGATEQISGSTSNNFTNTLTYTITAEDGSTIQDWLVTVSNGYIAKYPFTGDATDATNNNYDGTVYGAILTTDRFENENGAYSFDGVDDYIDFGDEMLLDEDFTISFFVKFGNPDDVFQYVLSKHKRYENNSGGWAFGQSSGVLDFGYFGVPSNHAYSGPFQFSDQEWYQMAITFNDTDNSLTFYLNGINIGTQSADINILDTVWPIWMGAVFGDIPAYYKIIVDEFSIYNGALSESDIYAYYANYHAPDTLIASEEDLRVTLSWDYDSDINPVKYYIYRDTSSPSTTLYDSLLITPGSTSSFVDESITSDTTYYYRITSVDSLGNESMYSNEVSSTQHLQVSDYDGNVYNTLRVGNQIWTLNFMATTHYADGTPLVDGTTAGDITGDYTTRYYFAQDNDEANVATYGRLYTWAAAVNGGSGSDANPGDVQGVCPTGWHVPGDSEWKDLEMYLGMSQVDADNIDWRGTDEGGQIKSISSEWSTPNTGASNTSGFAAMPGGYRHTSGSFCCTGEWSNSWTATSDDEIRAWLRSLRNIYSQIGRWQYLRTDARSVRCIKDLAPLDLDLAADYQFNNNAYDASAGDHDALVYGATLTTDRFDSSNAAYSFDGTDDWIDTGFGTTETYTDLSVNLWFKSSATGGQIISRYNTYPDTEGLVGIFMPDINDTYFGQIKFEGELTEQLYTSTSYDYNIWHMATLVLNATTLKLDAYVDGAFVGSASYDGDLIATAHKWNIGTRYDGDDTNGAAFFGGSIDDVRIYSRVLTGLEVYSLYANYHAPDTLIAREDDSQVSLHWNYNTEISPVKYNIYRNTTQGNPLLYDSVLVFSSADSLFIDNAVTNYNQYYYTISSVDSLGNESPLSEEILAIPCELITDYDGNTYRTIKIGKQIWMRENLSTTHYTDGTAMVDGTGAGGTVGDYTTKYQFSYNDDLNHAETYGRLYTWAAAMNGAASSNEVGSGVQGACPTGWYIPSDTAWKELEMYLGMNEATVNLTGWRGTDEGGKLKAPGTDYWLAPNTGATNETWFTALPGGSRSDGAFYDLLNLSYFWSATEPSDTTSLIRALRYINSGIHRQFYKKSNSMSIRCIKEHDPLEDSLLAYYPFNYSPDDASGNENHAVVNGASMTTDRLEYTNTAYAFDGVDDWIGCDFGASATYTDLTINTWFKAGTGGGQIVSRYDTYPGIDNMVSIRMNDNAGAYTGKLRFEGESGEYLYTNNTYEYGTWHMATLVLNSSTLKLDAYVDGLYVGSVNYDGTLGPSLYNWNIGARRDGDNTYGAEFFEGTLDEVRIYSRVLSDAEIIALYANYHAPDTLFVSSDDLKVILDWNYNSELNPVKYNVYKALNSSEFTYYGSVDIAKTTDTYFVDNDIIGDSTYHYKITSIDSLGNESLFSPEVAITPQLHIEDVDGNVYNTVRIGDQVWMQQNLAVTHYANGTPIADGTSAGDITSDYTSKYYFWYNNDSTTHAQNYGTLYTWAAAMDGAASYDSIPSGIQGVCPDGWHIPSDLEWKKLEMYIGMSQAEADGSLWRGIDEGGLLKAPDLWLPPNTGATNETGFNALPAGHRSQEGNFYDLNNFAYYWSTLENNASTAWNRALTYDKSTIYRTNYYKSNGLSVRCIRDEDRLDVGSMAYYPFNGDADDESKNGNVGTVHGATLTTDRYENENSAYSFDGIDDYISINTNSIFDFTSDATFSAFVKVNEGPILGQTFAEYTLFSKHLRSNDTGGWITSITEPLNIANRIYPSQNNPESINAIALGEWELITILYNSTEEKFKIYKNGELDYEESHPISAMPAVSASEFWIGALYNAGTPYNSFKGKIDDVRVYDRALTQSEIYHHYANYHPPDTLKVTENNLRVTLDWNYDTIRHPVKYYIYRDRMSPAVTLYDSVEIVNNSDTYYVDDNIESDTTYYYRITSVDPLGYESWFSDEVSITSYHPSVSDYNGNVYNTLRAGNQIWLQQNLLSTHYADGTILEDGSSIGDITGNYSSQYQFAFDDDDANTLIYGRLYTWAAAMRGATSSDDNPGTTQGVCPDGWHMPTDSEWKEFELQLGMSEGLINKMYNRGIDAGGRIKLDSTKYWLEPNLAATNSSGYTALPAGYRPPIGGFNHLKAYGYFWTATQEDISNAYLRGLHYNSAGIIRNRLDKAMAFSVRCLQNFSPLDDGLVAHYPFSGSPFDVSGNGNNGIITNAELSTDRFNNAISAYSFNGIDAGINFGHNSSQQFTNQLSLVAWVNPSELKSLEQMVISKWGDVDESFYLAIDNTGNPFGKIRFTDSQEVTITSNTDLPLNNWSMITMTYDGDSVYLYVNDTKTFSVLETRDIHSGTLDLIIANDNTGNLPFKGSIDDVRVYNRSLTALEIDSLYYENSWDIADIGTFTINEQTRETKIDKAAGTVLIEVAYGTEVTGLVPTFTLSPDASAKIGTDPQTSGVSTIDFTNPVIYTITATDGTTKDWEVTVGKTIEDFDNNIYSVVKIGYKTWMAENLRSTHYADGSQLIDGTGAGNISGDVSKYYFNYDDDVANVRNNGRLYTWSAVMNGATSSDLNESGIQGVCPTGWHLPSDSEFKYLETYLGMSPSDADLTDWRGSDEGGRLKGTTEWLQPNIGATDEYDFNMLPTGYRSVAGSFCCIDGYGNLWSSTESSESLAGIRSFVYSGARIARWDYHKSDAFAVRCVLDLKAEILSFALPDGTAPGTIDQINHIVDIEVVFGTLLTALTPTFSLSSESFATVDGNLQESGISTNNYSSSVIYTVTAEDGSTTDWTVNVTVALGAEKDILSFRINDIDGVLGTDTVTLELPYGEARSALTPVIIVSDSATITPDSGIVQDFSNPVTYTVIAEDGTTKSWVIIVTNGLNSATDIATFVLNEQTEPANIDAVNHTVSLEVAYGTDFSSLIPVFTSSFGSTLLVDGIVQTSSVSDRDFTNPVIYTVLAENGVTSQEWTVTIIEQADTEGPEIIHVNIPPTIYNVGTDSLVVSVIVTDNFELSKVTFNSRRPYSTAFTKEEYNPLSADNNYSKTLKEGREVTEEGLEYFFSAEDASGNISSTDTILMVFQYTNSGPFIPNLGYGGKAEDWRMFSIPYELSNNSIAAIFERELGAYDIFEWRLFHYQNDRFVENNDGLNAIERGKSYWFNSLNKVDIPVYPAKTPGNTQDNPFVIQLEPGWNQIGNPYLFDVAWADVINYPANTSIKVADHIRVQTDNGKSLYDEFVLKAFSGAYLSSESGGELVIPMMANSGGRLQDTNKFKEGWYMDLHLQAGKFYNTVTGLGMHPDAWLGKDQFDAMVSPRFQKYIDASFDHPEYFMRDFSKDIVPEQESYIWEFTVSSNVEDLARKISWTIPDIQDYPTLTLVDLEDGAIVNMLHSTNYSFIGENDRKFSVIYGDEEFLIKELAGNIHLGNNIPNPFTQKTTIPFSVYGENEKFDIQISIYSVTGTLVKRLFENTIESGYYEVEWDGKDSTGKPQTGLFIYSLEVESVNGVRSFKKKMIRQ